MFTITDHIRSIMAADTALAALVERRIFPLVAPRGTRGDFIVYGRDRFRVERTKMGLAEERATIVINVVSESYPRSQLVADRLMTLLEGSFCTDDDLPAPDLILRLTDASEDYDDAKFIQVLEFEAVYHKKQT